LAARAAPPINPLSRSILGWHGSRVITAIPGRSGLTAWIDTHNRFQPRDRLPNRHRPIDTDEATNRPEPPHRSPIIGMTLAKRTPAPDGSANHPSITCANIALTLFISNSYDPVHPGRPPALRAKTAIYQTNPTTAIRIVTDVPKQRFTKRTQRRRSDCHGRAESAIYQTNPTPPFGLSRTRRIRDLPKRTQRRRSRRHREMRRTSRGKLPDGKLEGARPLCGVSVGDRWLSGRSESPRRSAKTLVSTRPNAASPGQRVA